MADFDAFVRIQLPRLSRYALMLAGDHDLAADLVQDVLVKAFRQWARIESVARPDQYVMRMITNQYLSWRRSWSVRSTRLVSEVPERCAVDDLAATHAIRDDVWQRLAALPRRQRAVLVLRYYEQLTDTEIAELLGCATTTVRGYAHRALATMRAGLDADLLAPTKEN